ncbi:MAG: membrane protein insertase YidC [Gemmatimonadota bacterium]|nr:membrane protein insertase YidC [Gemmatimonadota bacterium]
MDRRTLLAIGLMLIIAVLPSILFPPERPPPATSAGSDAAVPAETTQAVPAETVAVPVLPAPIVAADDVPAPAAAAEVVVESPLYEFRFSTRGGRLVGARLRDYRTFAAGDSGTASIIPGDSRFLDYEFVIGSDTLRLADWSLEPSTLRLSVEEAGAALDFVGRRGAVTVELTYTFRPDHYLFDVQGRILGLPTGGLVLVALGPRIALVEADSTDDARSYAVVSKAGRTERLKFSSLDPGETQTLDGPFEWLAIKSKYFVANVLTIGEGQPKLGGALVVGGTREGKTATRVDVVTSIPSPAGSFSFSVYVGPQEYRRLARIGHDFEDINPYGWVFRPIIQPFANMIVVVLLWMHENLNMAYGWVLILFGMAVRVLLWPLNQKAMRSSTAMQAIQPEVKAVQERYKQDPQKVQQETMKLYKEHGVNPVGGCLPMLIPMPVLFALFFVFRETIEFRGVPFLWLPDLSRADPLYIIPVVMGLSMFAVSKLGQMGVPPNPQAKMMLYVMPPFLTFIFLKLSSGLNLYYAVSNIASIPQQWLIARERLRRTGKRE